jgi:predicted transcriptional regulator
MKNKSFSLLEMKIDDNKTKKNPQKSNELSLKRLELKIMKQILSTLYEEGHMKKTPLASKSGLNNKRSTLYLDWLSLLDLINVESVDNNRIFSINNKGRELYHQKFCN